ncbi:hypothetical protein [Timonella senegalensis]|uniref:hypothetical protein n=2 Tax=Timonella senegalensis TaxID=1465825 RepID=UPI002FDD0D4D
MTSRRLQAIGLLVLWVAVAVLGYLYFWDKNPERRLNAVISEQNAKTLGESFMKEARPLVEQAIAQEPISGTLPTNLAGVTVSAGALESFNQALKNFADSKEGIYAYHSYDENGEPDSSITLKVADNSWASANIYRSLNHEAKALVNIDQPFVLLRSTAVSPERIESALQGELTLSDDGKSIVRIDMWGY